MSADCQPPQEFADTLAVCRKLRRGSGLLSMTRRCGLQLPSQRMKDYTAVCRNQSARMGLGQKLKVTHRLRPPTQKTLASWFPRWEFGKVSMTPPNSILFGSGCGAPAETQQWCKSGRLAFAGERDALFGMWQWQVSTITFRTSNDGSSFGFLVMVAEVSHGGGLQKAVRACKSAR
ncbi:unnamed protein product [Effrenium voratum]|nr:unnamed protein product [Effrenium voratum]